MNPEQLQLNILEWKDKYKEVYQVNLIDQEREFIYTFIFRSLGREEYKALLEYGLEQGEFQELLCHQAVLYPDDYDFTRGLAGIAEMVSQQIIEQSGLVAGQAKAILDMHREEMFIYDYQADMIIKEVFAEYSLEEIQSWSVAKTMYYLSRAEWTLKELRGVPLISIDDIQQAQQAQQAQQQEVGKQPFIPQEEMPPEFQFQFEKSSGEAPPEQAPKKEAKPGEMTEAEVMAMLAQSESKQGRKVNTSNKGMDDMFPELNWFKHDDELRGNFD